ncbi:MAG: kelch repeat-containing protein [Planctomycetota bacterium]
MTNTKWLKPAILVLLLGVIVTGYGGLCDKDEATIAGSSTPLPSAVSALIATVISPTQVGLTWQDNSNNEDGFKIERSLDGITYTQIATALVNSTFYSDNNVVDGTICYYRVRAYNANGDSMYSNEAPVTIPFSAPTNLQVTVFSKTQINLSWTDNSNVEDGYKIERKTGAAGTYALLSTTIANTTSCSDTALTPDTIYYYRVRAYNSTSYSAYCLIEVSASITNWLLQTPTASAPTARGDHSMVWDGSKIILFSGSPGTNDLWWYEPVSRRWTEKTPTSGLLPGRRRDHSMVWDGSRVIFFGGLAATTSAPIMKNDLWWYDPVTNAWTEKTPTGSLPQARIDHSMVWDGSKAILFGGEAGGSYKNDLWWYDPVADAWTEKTPTGGPPSARYGHSMVWDGSKAILFGGRDGVTYKNDLWWYDPVANAWTEKTPTGGPPSARYGHSMVWDDSRVILFGGDDGVAYKNDLWWYDPVADAWTEKTTTGGLPSARSTHSMVWDGSSVNLFGGWTQLGVTNDLWWYMPY